MTANAPIDLRHRLELYGITGQTRSNVEAFTPTVMAHLDSMILNFYKHILAFPEVKKIIRTAEMERQLRVRQRDHWCTMLDCRFDAAYAAKAVAVGRAHHRAGVAPYLYIAGYNYFLCEMLHLASLHYLGTSDLSGILTSVARIVNLDLELALTAYTKEMWLHGPTVQHQKTDH
jgi:methyl-accepting chemotaxis protein